MWKKFKLSNFFYPNKNKLNFHFTPFVVTVANYRLQVMKASKNNIPDLLLLEKEVYAGAMPWTQLSFASELKKKDNSLYLVVYHESKLVAFIGTRFLPREAHITNIAVAPQYQNLGIASRLIRLMIKYASQNNSDAISLEVRIDNEKAKRLYSQLGFKATFIRKNYYQRPLADAVNMVYYLKRKRKIKE